MIFLSFFILLLANSCRETDTWEDYMLHENINEIKAVATLPSGEIIVVGYVKRDDENGPSIVIVKYLENGIIDTDFGENGIAFTARHLSSFESLICKVDITNEGNIVLLESITPEREELESSVAKYYADGNIDNSFGNMGIKKYNAVAIHSLELMENNNILISGAKSFGTSSPKSFFVSQLDQSGQEVPEFGSDGIATFDFNAFNTTCRFQKIQEDGKILLTGNTDENQNIVPMLRIHPNGNLDTTFSKDGKLLADMGYNLSGSCFINNTEDNKHLMLSKIEYSDLLFSRINQDGSLDSEFGQEGIAVNLCCPDNSVSVRSVFLQKNENFLILGQDKKSIILVDILPNGELNSAFGENGMASNSYDDLYMVSGLSVTKDGEKIIVTGEMRIDNPFLDSDTDFFIMRFNDDGSIDNSFGENGVVISDI